MSPDTFTVVPAAFVIMRRGNEVLMLRRANTSYAPGMYTLPSGHIEGGEPAHMAAIREAKEEVGVTIKPEDLQFVHVIHRVAEEGDHERVDFGYIATTWQGEPHNPEPAKCDDVRWCPIDDLPANTVPMISQALASISKGEHYSYLNF